MSSSSSSGTTACLIWAVVLLATLGFVIGLASASDDAGFSPTPAPSPAVSAPPPAPPQPARRGDDDAALPRKLLRPAGTGVGAGRVMPHRVSEGCAGAEDIAIYQDKATRLPSGVPNYTVEVLNRCDGDCAIADIHVRCGWFSSVSLVDPRKFRRLAHDDCLINDGQSLLAGETISFEYSNSFPYKLSVAVATCVDPNSAP